MSQQSERGVRRIGAIGAPSGSAVVERHMMEQPDWRSPLKSGHWSKR